jgi:hypothetical protein
MKKAFVPLLIIATGIGWILTTNKVIPGVNWPIVLLIAVAGILSLCRGLSKLTLVLGPMLLLGSVVMVMLQTKRIQIEMGLPVLVVAFGVLMLVARLSSLPDGLLSGDPEDNDSNDSTES